MRTAPAVVGRFVYGSNEHHGTHAHEYANVSVVLAGGLIERVGRVSETAGPLSVVVKPVGTEHSDAFGPAGAVLLRLKVGPEWSTPQPDRLCSVSRWRWVSAPAVARWLIRLAVTPITDELAVGDGIAECLGATDPIVGGRRSEGVPQWLTRIQERIRDEGGRGTRVAELARAAEVHPVYLTRRFRLAFGYSVVAAIQRERLRCAAQALSGPERLSHIALATGFSDQSHMTRAFTALTGVSPAVYRSLVQGSFKGSKASRTKSPE